MKCQHQFTTQYEGGSDRNRGCFSTDEGMVFVEHCTECGACRRKVVAPPYRGKGKTTVGDADPQWLRENVPQPATK